MKTLEQKAKELMDFIGTDCAEDKQAIVKALKEQDRDTRHACAEAVIQCNEDVSGECIWKNEAYSACMNA